LKRTLRTKLLLAPTVAGKPVALLTEKVCPLTFSWEISTGADPWFTRVTLTFAVCPTATEPKSTELVDATSVPAPEFVTSNVPEQPLRAIVHASRRSGPILFDFER
jgi:hypothetical protein